MANYYKMNIERLIEDSLNTKKKILADKVLIEQIKKAADTCITAFKQDGKVLLCGNGGSAADAQHIAAELSGRFNYDRDPLFAEALHVNPSFVTAVANDYSFEAIYSRMVKAAGKKGDVLIGISTSGNSPNVVKAVKQANKQGMLTICLTGENGGKLANIGQNCLKIPSGNTARIQESHILIGHIICDIVESTLFPE